MIKGSITTKKKKKKKTSSSKTHHRCCVLTPHILTFQLHFVTINIVVLIIILYRSLSLMLVFLLHIMLSNLLMTLMLFLSLCQWPCLGLGGWYRGNGGIEGEWYVGTGTTSGRKETCGKSLGVHCKVEFQRFLVLSCAKEFFQTWIISKAFL